MDDSGPVVVTCEHASFAVPPDCPPLGVGEEVLRDHVSWDPGALELAEQVARRLGASVVAGGCSRLVVDLNRSPDNPVVIPANSFGVPVPGNQGLSAEARRRRLERYHAPYWNEVARRLHRAVAAHGRALHVSVHSFTPHMEPELRKFDVGLLFDPARASEVRIARAVRPVLQRRGWSVEMNRPYRGDMDGVAAPHRVRFADDAYACLEVEVNQGRMTDGWAAALAEGIVEAVLDATGGRARRG
jgi:predicted N-formylglutamate amidohydrolase